MEAVEEDQLVPKQARYQAALRPDFFDFTVCGLRPVDRTLDKIYAGLLWPETVGN